MLRFWASLRDHHNYFPVHRSSQFKVKLTCFDVCVGNSLPTRRRPCRGTVSRCAVVQLRVFYLRFLRLRLSVRALVVAVRSGVRLLSRVTRGGSRGRSFPTDGFLSVWFLPVLLCSVAVVVRGRFGRPDVVFGRKSWDRTRDLVVVIRVGCG